MNLIGLKDVPREELETLLELAQRFLDDDGRPHTPPMYRDVLENRRVALLFFEPSTRTRVSFELAVDRLGGFSVRVGSQGTSIEKGETVLDTCRNLEAMGVDALVVRHSDRHTPYALADRVSLPIVNAGNGSGEHPTQALLDCLTLRQVWGGGGGFEGKTVAIVGDIAHSRVARSNVFAMRALGANVILAGPSMMVPKDVDEQWSVERITSREEALERADAVIMLRVQRERIHGELVDEQAYIRDWGLDEQTVEQYMKPEAVILHPGPVIRGMEMTGPVADSPRSLILRQVANAVAVRQAVLMRCLSED